MLSRLSKPDIEPLSGITWKSIEQQLFIKVEKIEREGVSSASAVEPVTPSARWLAAVVACAVAAAVLFLAFGRERRDGVHPEATFVQTSDSQAKFAVAGSTVTVAPRSALFWYSDDHTGMRILLENGSVECAVRPQSGGSKFVVNAADVRIEVVGTRFSATRQGGAVSVEVTEGTVTVLKGGRQVSVHAGERWSSEHEQMNLSAYLDWFPRLRGQTYNRAMALEDTQPERAIAIYTELSRGDDLWAANALFAHARLLIERDQRARARTLLIDYLARFPNAPNLEDARKLSAEPTAGSPGHPPGDLLPGDLLR